jgi:hypothetical protein
LAQNEAAHHDHTDGSHSHNDTTTVEVNIQKRIGYPNNIFKRNNLWLFKSSKDALTKTIQK